MTDYKKLIKDKKAEAIYTRMDADKALLYLDKYQMKDRFGKPIPSIINITLNDCAVFYANVFSSLNKASQQAVVETEDKNIDTSYIEDFQKATLSSANARLRKQGRFQLNPVFDEQNCIRGRSAFRCLVRMDGDILIPDIIPLDTRFFYYGYDEDGLAWGAYETTRSKEAIIKQYPKAKISGKDAVVIDLYDREANITWVGEEKVREDKNLLGYVPYGIQTVPLGSMLQDADSAEHQGESIFFLIRDIIPELNRLVSILQTINVDIIAGARLWRSEAGAEAGDEAVPSHEDLTAPGAVTATDIGGGAEPVPIAEVKRSAMMLHSMMETRMQRGSLSSIDLGTLAFPLSAVALVEIGEGRDDVFLPRLSNKAALNQDLAEMFTKQVIALGVPTVELGTPGHKRKFEVSKLKGEYETTYKYFTKSPKIDIARYSVATAAERYLDEDSILRDVLQLEDPDGTKQKRYYDMAAKISPAIMKDRVIRALLEQDEDYEAELLSMEMGLDLDRIKAGELPQPPGPGVPGAEAPPMPTIPLMAPGGGKTSAKKAAEMKATPREEGAEE